MKVIQLNVEKDRHRELVTKFIESEDPDVICLEEVINADSLPSLKERFGSDGVFVPMLLDDQGREQGVALLSKHPISNISIDHYWKGSDDLRHDMHTAANGSHRYVLLGATVSFHGEDHRFMVTHFPVSYPGEHVSEFQRTCYERMKELLADKEFVLCGDLNCPRGTEIFDDLASMYVDNVPKDATTTIDGAFHRAGPLQYVVDCMFTTEGYSIADARLVDGVSDHKALVARVFKNNPAHGFAAQDFGIMKA